MKRFLRPIFLPLARALGIFQLRSQVDSLSQHISQLDATAQSLLNFVDTKNQHFYDHVDAVQEAMTATLISHTEIVAQQLRDEFQRNYAAIKRSIDAVQSIPTRTTNINSEVSVNHNQLIDDAMYVALEDYFRGDKSLIGERQSSYLPYISNVVTSDKPLLDIGCGRGEWLTLLKQNNIPAHGIDSNHVCVQECKNSGLDVSQKDLIDALTGTPEGTLGAITLFQVLEHLPFPVLVQTLRLSLKALKPGGVFIGEVPNAETLSVGASTFWIDPTHERPLFPGLLKFVATEVGFAKVDGVYSSPLRPLPDLGSTSPELQNAILEMFKQLNGPGDFALIATA